MKNKAIKGENKNKNELSTYTFRIESVLDVFLCVYGARVDREVDLKHMCVWGVKHRAREDVRKKNTQNRSVEIFFLVFTFCRN